jgi:hypothetical protein
VVARLVEGHADAGRRDGLLHQVLVAEELRVRVAHPVHAERLAQPRGEQHARLPERDHAVEREAGALRGAAHRLDRPGLVADVALHVAAQVAARHLGELPLGHVAHAEHAGAVAREAAHEQRHLVGVAGGDVEDVHGLGLVVGRRQASSTRTVEMISESARSTAAVSGCRTMTQPSPS